VVTKKNGESLRFKT